MWPTVWSRPDWLTPVIQRQSAVLATSITSADVSMAGTLTLLIKMPAMVTFYRGHRRTLCCLPGITSLIIMCIELFSDNYFYIGGRTLPGRGSDFNSGSAAHCMRHALLHMATKWYDHWTTRPGQVHAHTHHTTGSEAQWSSGNILDCGEWHPRIKSYCQQFWFILTTTAIHSPGQGSTLLLQCLVQLIHPLCHQVE